LYQSRCNCSTHEVFFAQPLPPLLNHFLLSPQETVSIIISESESEFTANQFVLATSPVRLTTSNFLFQLNAYDHGPYLTSSLTRGWVCRLQLLLGLASAFILRSESRGTHDHILLSQIVDSPNLESQFTVFTSPRNRVAQLYPQALGSPFVTSYDSQGYGGGIRPHLHTESSLYSLRANPTEDTVSVVIVQQYLDCCLFSRCRGNLFTESLPNNERLLWLGYSGFQASYHNIVVSQSDK
jgi:hypothetical protein